MSKVTRIQDAFMDGKGNVVVLDHQGAVRAQAGVLDSPEMAELERQAREILLAERKAWGTALERIRQFSREDDPHMCLHDHKLQGTGVFFQSVGLIQCATCKGWQLIRKPIQ